MNLAPGLVLNERYEIRALLPDAQGRGAYRALDLRLGRDARIQAFELPSANELPALDRRTHALAGLQHARIRSFQDVGMLRREGYMVTPWLTGFTLAELGPLPAVRLRGWLQEATAALAAAHEAGIVHGAVEATSLVEVPGLGVLLQDFALPFPEAEDPAEDLRALGRVLTRHLADPPDESLRAALAVLAQGRMPTHLAPEPRGPRRSRMMPALFGAGLLSVLGLGVWSTLHLIRARGPAAVEGERRSEARRSYLEGRHHWNRRSRANLLKAEAALHQAIALDPTYAEAYVALAECQALGAVFSNATPAETLERTRATLRDLQRVDPSNPATTVVEAYLLFRYEHRWKEAEALFRKGLEPGSPSASDPTHLHWFGFFLSCLGRHEEALTWLERAVALEPLNLQVRTNLAVALAWAGRESEALAAFQSILELDSHFTSATDRLRAFHESRGDLEAALRVAERQAQGDASLAEVARALRGAYARGGAKGYWMQRVKAAREWERAEDGDPYFETYPHTALGHPDEAFDCLDRALIRNSPYLVWAYQDPGLASLRSDPRFAAFLHRLNLP
ncbi:MAG TPA: protein kinase family protein [Holophagaceae bacterium]|nr:protein kinase family protein [Holophagaceae bacterium]HJW32851.1 protein kinase family protein [Holophagaceae bacterium]